MQLHSFARYISSSLLSSFGVVVVWKCFISLSFILFPLFPFSFYSCFFFTIVNSSGRGFELSRNPRNSVGGVHHDCCRVGLSWLSTQEKRGDSIFPSLHSWCLSVLKMSAMVFFPNFGILGTCTFIELWDGILNLEYLTLKKMPRNFKWCIPLKQEIRHSQFPLIRNPSKCSYWLMLVKIFQIILYLIVSVNTLNELQLTDFV